VRCLPRLLLLLCCATPGVAAEGGEPGNRELTRLDPPWYDAEADDWRTMTPREEDDPPGFEPGVPIGSAVGWLIYLLIAVLGVGLVIWLILNWRRIPGDGVAGAEPGKVVPQTALSALPRGIDESVRRDPDAALREALAAGDWNRAAVCLHLALMVLLDRHGVVHLEPGRTDRAYLRELEDSGARPLFASTSRIFQQVFFGHLPVGRTEVDPLVAEARRLRERMEGGR